MGNRGALQVEADQVLFRLLDGFADRHGDFAGLTHAESGMAALIADDNQRGKAQILAALYDLGYALNRDNLILQIVQADVQHAAHR